MQKRQAGISIGARAVIVNLDLSIANVEAVLRAFFEGGVKLAPDLDPRSGSQLFRTRSIAG